MKLEISSNESSLESFLDKIVDGERAGQTFDLVCRGVSPGTLMQFYEITQLEGGKAILSTRAAARLAI